MANLDASASVELSKQAEAVTLGLQLICTNNMVQIYTATGGDVICQGAMKPDSETTWALQLHHVLV